MFLKAVKPGYLAYLIKIHLKLESKNDFKKTQAV